MMKQLLKHFFFITLFSIFVSVNAFAQVPPEFDMEMYDDPGFDEFMQAPDPGDFTDPGTPEVPTLEIRNPPSRKGDPVILDVLDLKNIDILDVLKLISQKSGINIIAGQNVTGRVTVFLRNIDVEEALKIIVEAYGWAYAKDGDIIKVMTAADYEAKYGVKFGHEIVTQVKQLLYAKTPDMLAVLNQIKSSTGKIVPDEKSGTLILVDTPDKIDEMMAIITRLDVPIKTEVFQLSYAKAEDVSGKLAEVLTPGVGTVKSDERTNRLVISDTPQKMEEMLQIISAFDKKERQVLIEAKILQVILTDEYKLGINWQKVISNWDTLTLTSDFDILDGSESSKGTLSIGTIDSDNYSLLIEALDTVGETTILSSPRIAAVNNVEASISVATQEPYVTSTTVTPATGTPTTSTEVTFLDVGVKLFVTPTIHEDDFISMKIKPEVSTTGDPFTFESGDDTNTIPVVQKSEAETTVTVKNKVTVVIGGLIRDDNFKNTHKVPILGDIPLLGKAFRNHSDKVEKNEIVIFLTPTIITGDVEEDLQFGKYY